MLLDFSKLTPDQAYAAMIQAIVPRPIAWVLSDNGTGDDGQSKGLNLAPFSFFNGVCGDPPMLMIACSRKPDGSRKDTHVNIEERGEFVVHSVHRELAATMVESSRVLPHGESELASAGLHTATVEGWPLPRVLGPRLAIWCTRHLIVNLGNEPQGLVIGQLRGLWIDDSAGQVENGRIRIDATKLDPVARLGGIEYVLFGEKKAIPRPS